MSYQRSYLSYYIQFRHIHLYLIGTDVKSIDGICHVNVHNCILTNLRIPWLSTQSQIVRGVVIVYNTKSHLHTVVFKYHLQYNYILKY